MNGMMLNIIVLILETIGLSISIRKRRFKVFFYYTQLSNIVTFFASLLYILSPQSPASAAMRYLSTVMLTMTFLITLFVLVPMGGGFRKLMLEDNGLYHHTLCPLISVFSYIVCELHSGMWILPVAVTFIYGIIMLFLNVMKAVDGPYPFFRVYNQSVIASVLWTTALVVIIGSLSYGVIIAASCF